MTLFNIAYKNVKKNSQNYLVYFISIVFNIMIYYVFASIKYNEQIEAISKFFKPLKYGFQFASVVIILFASIFIMYCNSFFIKKRKKEIGLYSMLGIKKNQIGKLLFYENIVMSVFALFIGIIFGSLLNNLFTMILSKFMGDFIDIKFLIEPKAIVNTITVFSILFLITSISGYFIIYRFKLIDLFKAENSGEKEPKISIVSALISVIIIGIGYIVAITTNDYSAHMDFLVTLILVVIGTFIFFNSFLVYIIKILKKNKHNYYKGVNLIAISHLVYRIKSHAKTFAIIALLIATTLTSVEIVYTWDYSSQIENKHQYPITYSYISNDSKIDNKVEDAIKRYPQNKLKKSVEAEFIKANGNLITENGKVFEFSDLEDKSYYLLSESKFKELARLKKLNYNYDIKNSSEVVLLDEYMNFKEKNYRYKIENVNISLNNTKESLKIIKFENYPAMNIRQLGLTCVVKDELYKKYYDKNNIVKLKGYIIDNPTKSKELSDEIEYLVPVSSKLSNYFYEYQGDASIFGLLLFIGLFIGLVFITSTASIIYFKQLIEGNEDKKRYTILKNIGMSKKEIKNIIKKQVSVVFAAPLIMGVMHNIVAFTAFSKILNIFNVNRNVWLTPSIITICIYVLIYYVYYKITVNSYNKIVN